MTLLFVFAGYGPGTAQPYVPAHFLFVVPLEVRVFRPLRQDAFRVAAETRFFRVLGRA